MADYLPLKALRSFEATARHLSFSKAAKELNVTTGAVSQQVKILEEFLGVQLLNRLSTGLELTEAGRSGLPLITQGFNNLTNGIRDIRDYGEVVPFKVWTTPSFASKWLIPRLTHFRTEHPNIDLQINVSEHMIEKTADSTGIDETFFEENDIDIAIVFGRSLYSGLQAQKLMPVSIVPLCSPKLVSEGEHPLRSPEDLRHHTLLHDSTPYKGRPDWGVWLKKVGLDDINARHGVTYNHISLVLLAAIEGQGVALGLMPLAKNDVDNGRLVIPFEPTFKLDFGYSIVCRERTLNDKIYVLFYQWLQSQMGDDG